MSVVFRSSGKSGFVDCVLFCREVNVARQSETEKARQQWNEKQARRAAGVSDFALTAESTLHKVFLEKSRF